MTHPTIAAAGEALRQHLVAVPADAPVKSGDAFFQGMAAAALRALADQLDEHFSGDAVAYITEREVGGLAAWLREICSEEGL